MNKGEHNHTATPTQRPQSNMLNVNMSMNSEEHDNDAFSLSSSISLRSLHSANAARTKADNSLIFERLVQDPLTDAQPIPHSLPRHVSVETFIPASLDTTTHMIKNNDFSLAESENNTPFGESEFGLNLSRRSSLANLEAALGGPSSRRPSTTNFQSSSYRLNSFSSNTISRSNTNTSFSNLTQQFQSASISSQRAPQNALNAHMQQECPHDSSDMSVPSAQPLSHSNSQNSNLPLLFKTSTSGSYSQRGQQTSASPLMQNKSFCSYADIIAQDDHEASFSIRRPSLSMSLSNQKLMRTYSSSSQTQFTNSANSQRSPSISSPFPNNFRNNSIPSPPSSSSAAAAATTASASASATTGNRNRSPNLNYMTSPTVPQYAIDDTDNETVFSFSSVSIPSATPRKSMSQQQNAGFSGRALTAYSMRVSNSTSSQIDSLIRNTNAGPPGTATGTGTPGSSTSPNSRQNAHHPSNAAPMSKITACAAKAACPAKSMVKNAFPQNELRKLDLSPQCSRPSDDESIKSYKTASMSTE